MIHKLWLITRSIKSSQKKRRSPILGEFRKSIARTNWKTCNLPVNNRQNISRSVHQVLFMARTSFTSWWSLRKWLLLVSPSCVAFLENLKINPSAGSVFRFVGNGSDYSKLNRRRKKQRKTHYFSEPLPAKRLIRCTHVLGEIPDTFDKLN